MIVLGCCLSAAADMLPLNMDGLVTDEFGKPVAGATVELVHRRYRHDFIGFFGIDVTKSAIPTNDGHFHIAASIPESDAYTYLLRAVAPGRGYGLLAIEAKHDAIRYFDVLRQTNDTMPWLILLP